MGQKSFCLQTYTTQRLKVLPTNLRLHSGDALVIKTASVAINLVMTDVVREFKFSSSSGSLLVICSYFLSTASVGGKVRKIRQNRQTTRAKLCSLPQVRFVRHLFMANRKSNVRAFAGGSEYFPVLADAIVAAKREILIADWWLTPEVYLKRDPLDVRFFNSVV